MGRQYIKRQAQPIATVRRGVQAAFLALIDAADAADAFQRAHTWLTS